MFYTITQLSLLNQFWQQKTCQLLHLSFLLLKPWYSTIIVHCREFQSFIEFLIVVMSPRYTSELYKYWDNLQSLFLKE